MTGSRGDERGAGRKERDKLEGGQGDGGRKDRQMGGREDGTQGGGTEGREEGGKAGMKHASKIAEQ